MIIAQILENVQFGEEKPVVNLILETPAVKEMRITFKKGQEMKAHQSKYPIVVEVFEGAIDFGVGTERHLLRKGMLIALDAHVVHDLKAAQESIVRLSLSKLFV